MPSAGKHTPKSRKPIPQPSMKDGLPDDSITGLDHVDATRRGSGDTPNSLKAYLETANVEGVARDSEPDDSYEALTMEKAEKKARRPGIKTKRPAQKQ